MFRNVRFGDFVSWGVRVVGALTGCAGPLSAQGACKAFAECACTSSWAMIQLPMNIQVGFHAAAVLRLVRA